MFRELLCNMRSFLNTEFGIVMNGEELLVHMLWADDLILMSSSEIGRQKQLDGLLKFVSHTKPRVLLYGARPINKPVFTFNKGNGCRIHHLFRHLRYWLNNIKDYYAKEVPTCR